MMQVSVCSYSALVISMSNILFQTCLFHIPTSIILVIAMFRKNSDATALFLSQNNIATSRHRNHPRRGAENPVANHLMNRPFTIIAIVVIHLPRLSMSGSRIP